MPSDSVLLRQPSFSFRIFCACIDENAAMVATISIFRQSVLPVRASCYAAMSGERRACARHHAVQLPAADVATVQPRPGASAPPCPNGHGHPPRVPGTIADPILFSLQAGPG